MWDNGGRLLPPVFLPQRRPRVWALFLKIRGGMGPKAIRNRDRDLVEAFAFIQSSQTRSHEPLTRLLERIPTFPVSRPTKQARGGQEWRTLHGPNFQRRHGLEDDEVRLGQNEFDQATADVLSPRQQAGVWLELCKLRKKGQIPNWKSGLFVSDCGSSVGWLSVVKEMFPCVRPGNAYLVLNHGTPNLAQGHLYMAVQGIGPDEAKAFDLHLEDDSALRQMAGNAFCANTCLVFLVAALMFA